MLEEGIYILLVNDTGISALAADRIYPVLAPPEAPAPLIVFLGVSIVPVNGISGQNKLTKKRMQFDCYGQTYSDAKKLEQAVNHVLINYQGTLSDGDSTYVNGIQSLLSQDLFDSDANLYRVSLDFEVWFIATY
jgi:hypothetical protein